MEAAVSKPRVYETLTRDGETAESLRNALETLNELKPTTPRWIERVKEIRQELLQELQTIEGRLL